MRLLERTAKKLNERILSAAKMYRTIKAVLSREDRLRDAAVNFDTYRIFSTQQIALTRYILSPARLSDRLSVTRVEWISQERLKLGSCNFHYRVYSHMTLVSSRLTSPRNSKRNMGRRMREGYEK